MWALEGTNCDSSRKLLLLLAQVLLPYSAREPAEWHVEGPAVPSSTDLMDQLQAGTWATLAPPSICSLGSSSSCFLAWLCCPTWQPCLQTSPDTPCGTLPALWLLLCKLCLCPLEGHIFQQASHTNLNLRYFFFFFFTPFTLPPFFWSGTRESKEVPPKFVLFQYTWP